MNSAAKRREPPDLQRRRRTARGGRNRVARVSWGLEGGVDKGEGACGAGGGAVVVVPRTWGAGDLRCRPRAFVRRKGKRPTGGVESSVREREEASGLLRWEVLGCGRKEGGSWAGPVLAWLPKFLFFEFFPFSEINCINRKKKKQA